MWPFKKNKIVEEPKLPVVVQIPELSCIAKSILGDLKQFNYQEYIFTSENNGVYCPSTYRIKHPNLNYILQTYLTFYYLGERKQVYILNFREDLLTQYEQDLIWEQIITIYKKQADTKEKEKIRLEDIELAKIFPQCFKN